MSRRARAAGAPRGLRGLTALARVHSDDLTVLRPNHATGRLTSELHDATMIARRSFDDRRCMTASLAHEVHYLHTMQLSALTIRVSVETGAGEPLQNCLEELHKRLRSVTVVRPPYTATLLPRRASCRPTKSPCGF